MTTATASLRNLVRVAGTVQVALGLLFWSGNLQALIPVHMLVGLLLVLSLWALAILAAVARVHPGPVALALLWGLLVPLLGVLQTSFLPGDLHWVIQTVHLAAGLVAIGLAEWLARLVRRRRALTTP